ncbi:MAG: hypothetical protein KDC44_08860, partial [Phaeodactylibacter sp.]|nr:hypothetical protein [Phaeodactylibacter sp.]
MMQNFLKKLNALNVKIAAKGDQLDIQAPKGVMTPALIAELKEHKDALLHLLQSTQQQTVSPIPRAPEQEAYVLSSAQQRM